MTDTCVYCNISQTAETYCLTCSVILCINCINRHLDNSSLKHQLINYQLFLEQNTCKEQEKKLVMKKVSGWLKERLIEANIEIDSQYSEVVELINKKKEILYEMVDGIFELKLKEHEDQLVANEKVLEFLISNKTPIHPKILTVQDTENFIFSEILHPGVTVQLEQSIIKEFNYNLEVYLTGKPLPIYAFKPNTSQVLMFDILSEEEVFMNIKNFECKIFAGWCLMGSNIIYTGGWKQGYSSFEVFEINTSKWVVEPKPHLLTPRHQHAIICIEDTVYVFGGATKSGLTNLCEKWKSDENDWTEIESMQVAKTQMGICAINGFIYLSNDTEIERYCIKNNAFETINVKFELRMLTTLVSKDSHILIFRPGDMLEYETETGLLYKACDMENIDLWSSTHPVSTMDKVYFFLENLKIVYKFDLTYKKLEFLTDFYESEELYAE